MQPNFMWYQKIVLYVTMPKWSDSGLTFFNIKTLSLTQFTQKLRKTMKSLPCYLEFYLERPLPEHSFLKK